MTAKAILVFCAQALFVQSALSQCTSRAAVAADPGLIAPAGLAAPYGFDVPLAYNGLAAPYGFESPYGLGSAAMAAPYGLATTAMAAPYAWASPAMDFTPTRGGALPVTSASAIPPDGLSVKSENFYEGILAATGELPFVGSVAVEGTMPSAGASAVNHACGNGINAMTSESTAFAPGYPAAIEPAAAISPAATIAPGFGYHSGWADRCCGYAL